MFLLLLMGLGAAGVKAQVRIGGNGAPNASAVLDLNATDATTAGTKGLALPRVALTSNTMLLSDVTTNLTGMLVYNTSTTGGIGVDAMGIYYWDGAHWIRANLPSAYAADSGYILASNGSQWVPILNSWRTGSQATVKAIPTTVPVAATWQLVSDDSIFGTLRLMSMLSVSKPGFTGSEHCKIYGTGGSFLALAEMAAVYIYNMQSSTGTFALRLRCYRPSV